MKKAVLISSLLCFCLWGMAQTKAEDVGYKSTEIINLPQYYQGVVVTPFLCDYKVLQNSMAEKTETYSVDITGLSSAARNAYVEEFVLQTKSKLIAGFKSTTDEKADVIISITQEVEVKKGSVTITVKGYPAKYTNFRVAKPEDQWILDFYSKAHIPRDMGTIVLENKSVTVTK
jgi:hypothetical protein